MRRPRHVGETVVDETDGGRWTRRRRQDAAWSGASQAARPAVQARVKVFKQTATYRVTGWTRGGRRGRLVDADGGG